MRDTRPDNNVTGERSIGGRADFGVLVDQCGERLPDGIEGVVRGDRIAVPARTFCKAKFSDVPASAGIYAKD